MSDHWPYYTVSPDGKSLLDEAGDIAISGDVVRDGTEWEAYLENNDLRGTVC